MKKILILVLALALSFSLVTAVPVAAQDITDPVSATIVKTDALDVITFDMEIFSDNVPHGVYGVGLVFATSLDHPAFQVYYAEAEVNAPNNTCGWYYQDWTGDGWNGWGGDMVLLSEKDGFSAVTREPTEKTFSVSVPTAALGGYGATYYYAIQVRTNLIGWYPAAYDWSSDVSAFATGYTLAPPTKADILNGVPGKGLDTAPGLQKPFNPNSQAGANAGKK